MRAHGIKLLGSTIVGLEHHTPENIHEEIEHAVAHDTDFHQFMLYTPVPGTPLFAEMTEQGRMLEGVDLADIHGQHQFNFRHAAISREDSKKFLDWRFPPRFRTQRAEHLSHLPHHAERLAAVQERPRRARARPFRLGIALPQDGYASALWAMEKHLRHSNPAGQRQDPRRCGWKWAASSDWPAAW